MSIFLEPIGVVRTSAVDLPRHWSVSDVAGTLVMDEDDGKGLRDIQSGLLRQTSGETGQEMGVFSLCSPVRPNPIGSRGMTVRRPFLLMPRLEVWVRLADEKCRHAGPTTR